MKFLFHPVTIFNLLICGTLGMIQVVHTRAHYMMEIDVHAYCLQNAEHQDKLNSPYEDY